MHNYKRYIEHFFPINEVGSVSAKEKYIRKGNISTLHVWWSRKPLASSRTTCYAALIPYISKAEKHEEQRKFIIDLSKWENALNQRLLSIAQSNILTANKGKPPKVLDPFAGGGSIPLEALRLGCEVHSSDINPVAVLIQKCILEFPQLSESIKNTKNTEPELIANYDSRLIQDISKWATKVFDEAVQQLKKVYISESTDTMPLAFLWARTVPCQNPSCGLEIPLMAHFWVCKKPKKQVALRLIVKNGKIDLNLVGNGYAPWPKNFDPDEGTISRAVVICPACKSTIDASITHRLFREGKSGDRMLAVVLSASNKSGKRYQLATEDDNRRISEATEKLQSLTQNLHLEWGLNPVPDEDLPPKGSHRAVGSQLPIYGFKQWGDIYNERQKLTMVILTQLVREAYDGIKAEEGDGEYARVVATYLGLLVSRLSNRMSTLSYWYVQGEKIQPTFVRQALAMTWNYVEMNPLNSRSGGWYSNLRDSQEVLNQLTKIKAAVKPVVRQGNSTTLSYPDDYFDAVLTDPPYYDNVPYSHLSDYFYVWLKRSIGFLYPELFSTPLTPKNKEILAHKHSPREKEDFEENLRAAFKEIQRVLKPTGIGVIVYAHKSTEGWESLIDSLLDSGLVVVAAWPINTEMRGRIRAHSTASLASSIYIIVKKYERVVTGVYKDLQQEIRNYLESKLPSLWTEGIGGADFFIAAIASAIEVFGKYKEVIDYEGNTIRAARLLEDVRQIVTDFAVQQILHIGFSENISPITRFYILYRWNYQDSKVHFDEARKLAQSCGIDLVDHWTDIGIIRKSKEFIIVAGPKERKLTDVQDSDLLIDILHHVLILWEKGRKKEITKILVEKKLENSEMFWRVAQCISETLPTQNKEKKLLDGFLVGRTGYQSEDMYEQETLE